MKQNRGRADPEQSEAEKSRKEKSRKETSRDEKLSRAEAQTSKVETRRKGEEQQRRRGQNRQSSVQWTWNARAGTRWAASGYIESAPCWVRVVAIATRTPSTKERRTSSTSNAAHTSSSRARLHNARAPTTPLTRRSATVQHASEALLLSDCEGIKNEMRKAYSFN